MIELKAYQLRLISTVFTNIGSAFLFAAITTKYIYILTSSLGFVILFLGIATHDRADS